MDLIFNIIAFTVLGIALFFAMKKIIQALKPKEKVTCSSGCDACTMSCDLKKA